MKSVVFMRDLRLLSSDSPIYYVFGDICIFLILVSVWSGKIVK